MTMPLDPMPPRPTYPEALPMPQFPGTGAPVVPPVAPVVQQPQPPVGAPAVPPVQPIPDVSQTPEQLELNRVGTEQFARGTARGKRDVLAETGFNTTAELVAYVTASQAKTGGESALQQSLAASKANEAALTAALGQRDLTTTVSQALLTAGVQGDRLGIATQAVLNRPEIANHPDGVADVAAINLAVGTFSQEVREWFTPAVVDPNAVPVAGQLPIPPPPLNINPQAPGVPPVTGLQTQPPTLTGNAQHTNEQYGLAMAHQMLSGEFAAKQASISRDEQRTARGLGGLGSGLQ